MAVVLVHTPKADNANAYLSLAEADAYFESRLHAVKWVSTGDADDRRRAIIMATRHIDQFIVWDESMAGTRTTYEQALEWPRIGAYFRGGDYFVDSDVVPAFLKDACAEQALFELQTDRGADPSRGVQSVTAGPVSVTFDAAVSGQQFLLADAVLRALTPWALNANSNSPTALRQIPLER